MDHKQRVINYYDATHIDYRALWSGSVARAVHFGLYDEEARTHPQALIRMNAFLAEAVQISSIDKVLDAGCGYGGSAMWLAEKYGCSVTGVTVSPLQVEKGHKYIGERQLENKVAITEGDYGYLSFPENTFSVYWALESWVHAANRKEVCSEAYRVLQPGGRIVIAEYTLRDTPALNQSEKVYLQPWLDGWAMPSLLTTQQMRGVLSEAGFEDIKIVDITEQVKPSLRRLEILSILNYPIALFIAPFFFRKERVENYWASWRQIQALKHGIWRYSVITARKKG